MSSVCSQLDTILDIVLLPSVSCPFVEDVSTSAIRQSTHARMMCSKLLDHMFLLRLDVRSPDLSQSFIVEDWADPRSMALLGHFIS